MPLHQPLRVAIVSGSYGAGHDVVAGELARRLVAAGAEVQTFDVARLLPLHLGQVLRFLYFRQLRTAPSTWTATLNLMDSDGGAGRWFRLFLAASRRRLVRLVADRDLAISTHPFASQALGTAKVEGELSATVATYLTDASVHRMWVHRGVDLHVAIHAVAARQAEALGVPAVVIDPVVPAAVPNTGAVGVRLPWPVGQRTALILGGSRGVGELRQTAEDVLATGLMSPVVACGTNTRLLKRLRSSPGIVALGWRDDLRHLMAAADCVIQNAGGISSLEALMSGTATLSYRTIPGHGVTNARALDEAGLIPHVADLAALHGRLSEILAGGEPSTAPEPVRDCLDVVLSAHEGGVTSRAVVAA